jgi:hypothetical protein
MRTFVAIRKRIMMAGNKTIEERVLSLEWMHNELRSDIDNMNEDTKTTFDELITELSKLSNKISEGNAPRRPIGFK